MKFKGIHPQTGETLFGCPRFLVSTGQWIIEWFARDNCGWVEGETFPSDSELAWIVANIPAVREMQEKCLAWRERVDDIPF